MLQVTGLMNLTTGNSYQINNTSVLHSLTSVGTLSSLNMWIVTIWNHARQFILFQRATY
jgi:uncharacterized protein YkvS